MVFGDFIEGRFFLRSMDADLQKLGRLSCFEMNAAIAFLGYYGHFFYRYLVSSCLVSLYGIVFFEVKLCFVDSGL